MKPSTYISANAPMSATGMVTSGTSVARTDPQEHEDDERHQHDRLGMVRATALIERSMKTEVS